MGNIRSFGGIKKIVLYFDYYYSSARFFFYKVMQLGGRLVFPIVLMMRFREYCCGQSFYPECKRKKKYRIFLDHLLWILRKGELNNFYYMWGFDRREVKQMYDFVGEVTWTNARRKKNEVKKQWKFYNASCLLMNKFYFGNLSETLGFATPHNRYLINNGIVTDLEKKEIIGYDEFLKNNFSCFCKNAVGGGGKDADNFILKIENGKIFILDEQVHIGDFKHKIQNGTWIVQDKIERQFIDIAKYHEYSINTIRLVTVCDGTEIVPIAALARFGQNGRVKDNGFSGGIIVPVDIKTGIMNEFGFMPVQKKKTRVHPNSNIAFGGVKIPKWDEMIENAIILHRYFYNIHSIGWDICVTDEGVCFIEGNDDWHVVDAQVNEPGMNIYRKYFK